MFGCAAVCSVPVTLVAVKLVALTVPPEYILPVEPMPPVTTSAPVVVLVLAMLAVVLISPFAVSVVNAPAALVELPIATLSMLPADPGAMLTLPLACTVNVPLKDPDVATSADPSSDITI
jgi:hypothetical protein